MSEYGDYFRRCSVDARFLSAHGLDHWPEGQELARLVLQVEEKVDLLAGMLGYKMEPDVFGRIRLLALAGDPHGREA